MAECYFWGVDKLQYLWAGIEIMFCKMLATREVRNRAGLWFVGLLLLCFGSGCGTGSQIQVSKYDSDKAQQANALVYYLPQTVLDFDFSVACSYYTPGPYAQYCEKFLGIAAVATQPVQHCQLAGVKITTHQEVDTRYPILAHLTHGQQSPLFLQLTANGMLMPANELYPQTANVCQQNTARQPYCYTDLSSDPFIDSEKNVFHSVVQKDTSFVSVPVTREVTIKRSLEEKARQAADQIFALRKRRIELLLGDDMPTTPDGIPTILKEIARLEAEYLMLFVGRTTYDTVHVQRSYTPLQSENTTILCRFSDTQGIVPSNDMTASPILLQLTCDAKETIDLESIPTLHNAYYYRTAFPTDIQLSLDGENIYQGRIAISQYGKLMHAPVQLRLSHAN